MTATPKVTLRDAEESSSTDLALKYDLVLESVAFGDRSFSIHRVRDTNALLDSLTPDDLIEEDRFPYWAHLWNSSLALAEWCLSSPAVPGARVLELGCGLGLAGIAAAAAGASVTMTDHDRDALQCARLNVMRNFPTTKPLPRIRVAHLDWRKPTDDARYDIIIGADITYEKRLFHSLLDLFHSMILLGGTIVLADPDRAISRTFFEMAVRDGFSLSTTIQEMRRGPNSSTILLAELREGR